MVKPYFEIEKDKLVLQQIQQMIFNEISEERYNQDREWGESNHPYGTSGQFSKVADRATKACHDAFDKLQRGLTNKKPTWRHILQKTTTRAFASTDPTRLRKYLIQTAAVCVAWIECIDRNEKKNSG